jgi:hypothetical protein
MAPRLAAAKTAGSISPTQRPVRTPPAAKDARPQIVTPARLFLAVLLTADAAGVVTVQGDPAKSPLYAGLAAASLLAAYALLPQYAKYSRPVRVRAWVQAAALVATLTARGLAEGWYPANWFADLTGVTQLLESLVWLAATTVVLVRLFVRSFAAPAGNV